MRGGWWCLRLLAAALLVVGSANAAPPREAPDLVVDDALEKMKSGDLQGARRQLERALMVEATPRRLYHLALVEREMGHRATALRVARRLFAHPDADRKKLAVFEKTFMADLVASTARVAVEAPRGSVVEVDDYIGEAPLPFAIDLEPGDRIVQLKIDGHQVDARAVSLKAGDLVSITLHAPSTLQAAPVTALPSSPPQTISPVGDSYRPVAGYVVPSAILGGAAIALGFGIGYAVESNRAYDEVLALAPGVCADQSSVKCADQRARVAHVNALNDTSLGFYVASAVLAAGAVVSFLVWPSSRRDLRVTASPTGLGVMGRF